MLTTQVTKSNLAKLLATENINVEYRNTDTASFNIESRTLTLPLLNDMSANLEDLFIGHEVGHALDTPLDFGSAQENMPSGFKTFLNVVEDARIERRIKDRYPGLKKSFNFGYKEFLSRDFFQVKDKDVNQMLLIDRINLHFKIGPFFPVNFNEVEQDFVKKVAACETFDDVIAVSKELYEYCKEELEQKRQEAMEEFKRKLAEGEIDDMSEDLDDSFGNPFDDEQMLNPDMVDSDNDEDFDSDNKQTSFSHESVKPKFEDHTPPELADYDEVKSLTDENLEDSLRDLAEKKEIRTGMLGDSKTIHYDRIVVPYKALLNKVFESKEYYKPNMLIEFEQKTKNSVSYLVKEFEMKKKAAELRRAVESNTGVIDTNKLHTYKFNDNIFRKVGSIPAGKNHGIVMFIDWSGSMTDNLAGTVEQLITMTTFCRKVNVPFEVYAFSTEYLKQSHSNGVRQSLMDQKIGELEFGEQFALLNLFSSRMRNQEYRTMANDLLNFASMCNSSYSVYCQSINHQMTLGGTPLNATIFAASGVVNNFRKLNKTEIVDVIFLTDGEDSNTLFSKNDSIYGSISIGEPTRNSVSYIQDKETHKRYRVDKKGVTPVLLQILKDRTGCNLIGFYVLPGTKKYFTNAMSRFHIVTSDTDCAKFRSEKHFAISNYGYDQYFLIPGGKDLTVEDEDLDTVLGKNNTDVSARKLKGAFLKMNQNRLTNRVLLSKVIEEIA
jgi:hypothetical protein